MISEDEARAKILETIRRLSTRQIPLAEGTKFASVVAMQFSVLVVPLQLGADGITGLAKPGLTPTV